MKLIVGLGNPGRSYARNRHNVGFMCLDHFARAQRIPLTKRQSRAMVGIGEIAGQPVVLAKPQTFMNASGEAVSRLVRQYHIANSDLLVISDDLDLPLGKIRLRERGSHGGHKGMKSIIDSLATQDFPRLRAGIGRPQEAAADVVDWVLDDFTPEERAILEQTCARVAEAILCILSDGITAAMNKYNPV